MALMGNDMQQAESYIDGLVRSLWDEDETIRLRAIDELAKIGEPADLSSQGLDEARKKVVLRSVLLAWQSLFQGVRLPGSEKLGKE